MFVGHFAVGFAAKRWFPRVSLGTLFLAAQWVDLIWPLFLLLGWEQVRISPGNTAVTPLEFAHYPITHSLVGAVVWGGVLGFAHYVFKRRAAAGLMIAALTLSHWLLDFVTHRPDLPLWPGGPKAGLELWSSLPATMAVELPLYAIGLE